MKKNRKSKAEQNPENDLEKIRQLEAQIKDLQKQVAEREEESAILKKALHVFSKPREEDSNS